MIPAAVCITAIWAAVYYGARHVRRDMRYRDGLFLERDETDVLPSMGRALTSDERWGDER